MLALIKKDAFLFSPVVYIFLALLTFAIVFSSLPATFAMIIPLFGLALSPFTYDDKNKTNITITSLPISRQMLVMSRYLFGLCILLAILGVEWIGTVWSFSPNYAPYEWKDFLMFLSLGLILLAICYPILFSFKNSYMSMFLIFIIIAVGSFFTIDVSVNIMGMTEEIIFNRLDKSFVLLAEKYIPFLPYYMPLFVSLVLFISSIQLSTVLLRKRDLV